MPDFRGTPDAPLRRIGEVELLSALEDRRQDFGVAAWWQKVLCKPQTVELKSNGYWVVWTFAGIVTDAHFPTLFGGKSVGVYDKTRDISKPSHLSYQWYANGFAYKRMNGKLPGEMLFHLDPQFGCGVRTLGYRDGEIRTSYFLTTTEESHHGHLAAHAQR